MFKGEERGSATDERRKLAPIFIALVNTYAGLSTGVAGFVLDKTVLVVVGVILVGSSSILVNLVTKAMNRSESARLHVHEKGQSAGHCIYR